MTYSIHVCTVGFIPEPSLAFMKHGMPIDKMYLLNSDNDEKSNECEKAIRKKLKELGVKVETVVIDPYDFTQIYDSTLSILDMESDHKDAKYYINFTNGTRVMSAAVTSAAFLMNSELYYVMNEEEQPDITADQLIRHYQVFNFPEIDSIKGTLKEILMMFSDREYVYNRFLRNAMNMKGSKLRYYTRQLEEYNLITCEKDGKEIVWHLTDLGTSVVKRLYKPINMESNDKGWLSSNSKSNNHLKTI